MNKGLPKMKLSKVGSIALVSAGFVISGLEVANAASFNTVLTFDTPTGTPTVDSAVIMWSTSLESGIVFETDLDDWMYELRNGDTVVYSETVISGGVVQPIGGVGRTIDDLFWLFDLDAFAIDNTTGYLGSDNDGAIVQFLAATGITYNTFGVFPELVIDRFEDGLTVNSAFGTVTQLTTPKAVPEPSTVVGLGLLGLGLLGSKKKSKV